MSDSMVTDYTGFDLTNLGDPYFVTVGSFDHNGNNGNGMNNRFDKIDTRMDSLETRLNGVESRLDGVEKRLDGIENCVNTLKTQVAVLDSNTSNLTKEVSHLRAITLTCCFGTIGVVLAVLALQAVWFANEKDVLRDEVKTQINFIEKFINRNEELHERVLRIEIEKEIMNKNQSTQKENKQSPPSK